MYRKPVVERGSTLFVGFFLEPFFLDKKEKGKRHEKGRCKKVGMMKRSKRLQVGPWVMMQYGRLQDPRRTDILKI
jgi:hypothetical protein